MGNKSTNVVDCGERRKLLVTEKNNEKIIVRELLLEI